MVTNQKFELPGHTDMANAIRALSMDAVQKANSGHPGMPLGMADVVTVLFSDFLKFDSNNPEWPDRDRFVLSAGHGSMLLYSLLYLLGYPEIDIDQIKHFRKLGSKTAGHPEFGAAKGIEVTTGPLGQGLATAVGMAIGERNMAARFGESVVDHYTYVIAGDGCLMEGVSHEAISLAGYFNLDKLIVLYDSNNISIDGPLSLSCADDVSKRFEASGWNTIEIDGHNPISIKSAIKDAKNSQKPSLIICQTTIGYGTPTKAGSASSHGAPLGEDEIAGARKKLGWPHKPFLIPEHILSAWRHNGTRGNKYFVEWQKRLANLAPTKIAEFNRLASGQLPNNWNKQIQSHKKQLIELKPKWATRVASQKTLEKLLPELPELIGGSADLTGSNGTKTNFQDILEPKNFSGNYIHYGVREHAMAAVMNGLSLHGGIIPYGGTFLVFSDYCRPSIRLSALMSQKVIYVMTHDSIGLGEDGPTHQPIEHLASLRAIPDVNVMRPADAVETTECWEIAIGRYNGPSVLALTRQGVPLLRETDTQKNLCEKGAYELRKAEGGNAKAVIFATGSEVSLAVEARKILQLEKIPTRVVSVPSWMLFEQQSNTYKQTVLGNEVARVAVEAGSNMGWNTFVGPSGSMIGINTFGASGPANELYNHFNITTEQIVLSVKSQLQEK
tara:strand:+ start:38 stop:2047 length:2010 start_codon:yes stop_codon:yes gene_type:complete